MKSKVTIDVDNDNQPVIKIEYSPSEDVRDKLVKRFLESFGGESRWAEFYFLDAGVSPHVFGQGQTTSIVKPLSIFQMIDQKKSIDFTVNNHVKFLENLEKDKKKE